MRNIPLAAALLAALTSVSFAQNAALEEKFRLLNDTPAVKGSQWAVYMADTATGQVLLAKNSAQRLIPASTLKLFVTAAALSKLGPEHRFRTRIYADGKISGGTLRGNIVILGGGDPVLGSTVIRNSTPAASIIDSWADSIAKAGIRSVTGGVKADALLYGELPVPGSWPYEDLGNYYAAESSALSINDNQYRLCFRPGRKEGDAAEVLRTEPAVKGLSFKNFMKTGPAGSGDNGYIYRAPGQYEAELRGTIPLGPKEFCIKGSLPEPALFTARLLEAALAKRGVKLGKTAALETKSRPYRSHALLAETLSHPVRDIVFITNKRSFNFYAEMLLRALSSGDGSEASGLAAVRDFLKQAGVPQDGVKLADACGLSKNNLVSAEALGRLMTHMRKSAVSADFERSLPVPGDEDTTGHIKRFCCGTAAEGKVKLKSGSLNGVRSYAGYLRTASGKTLAFAFIINNYQASGDAIDKLHEELAETAARL